MRKTSLMYVLTSTRKIPLTVLVRALGFGSDDTIFEILETVIRYATQSKKTCTKMQATLRQKKD